MAPSFERQEWFIAKFYKLRDEFDREVDKQLKNDPSEPKTYAYCRAVEKIIFLVDFDRLNSLPDAQRLEDKDVGEFNIFLLGALLGQKLLLERGTKINLVPDSNDLH